MVVHTSEVGANKNSFECKQKWGWEIMECRVVRARTTFSAQTNSNVGTNKKARTKYRCKHQMDARTRGDKREGANNYTYA